MKDLSTEVTKTSPLAINAISLPFGEIAISLIPPLIEINLSVFAIFCVVIFTFTLEGFLPSFMVYNSPSKPKEITPLPTLKKRTG